MRIRMNRRRWTALAIVASAGLLLTILSASLALAAEYPLRGCFNKTISDDPMICYILEQAQEEEIIEVAAIYRADDDLHYVYLTQTEPVEDKVGEFFRDRAEEFIDSWPEVAPREPYRRYYQLCMNYQRDTRAWRLWWHDSRGVCLRELTKWSGDDILPYSGSYGSILLRPGGPDARHSERAWASFRQVWPAAATPDTSGAFDVSDVDLTNFPEFGCLRLEYRESCEAGTDHPKADIAGWDVGVGITFVQYKNPPEGEEELEALKDTLIPYCNKVAVCTQVLDTTTGEAATIATAISTEPGTTARLHGPLASAISTTESALVIFSDDLEQYHNQLARLLRAVLLHPNDTVVTFVYPKGFVTEMEIIPVNHNYADLRRYETILNRFVHSRGNTVGILDAKLSTNHRIEGDNVLWTPDGPGMAEKQTPSGYYYDWDLIRDTIVVSAFDSQRVLDALPELLPALGIPVDAVGAVYEESDTWSYDVPNEWYPPWSLTPWPPDPFLPRPTPVLHQFLAAVGVPHWMPLWASYTVLGIVVLGIIGSIVFITYRLLIRLVRFMRLRRA